MYCYSPPLTSQHLLDEPLSILIDTEADGLIELAETFTYRPNPIIHSVQPLESIAKLVSTLNHHDKMISH